MGKPWGTITTTWLYKCLWKIDRFTVDELFSNVTQQKCHFLKHVFIKVACVRDLWCQKQLECLQVYPSSSLSLNSASKCDSAISMEIYGNVHFFCVTVDGSHEMPHPSQFVATERGFPFPFANLRTTCWQNIVACKEVWCILNWNPPVSGTG